MRVLEVSARESAGLTGRVLCHNVFDPEKPKSVLLRKGRVLTGADAATLGLLGDARLHLLELEEGDIGETEAGLRLGLAAAGPGVRLGGESQSQVRLEAATRGLLRVDQTRLARTNALDGVLVWTIEDAMPVEEAEHVASAKVAPLAIPGAVLRKAEERAGGGIARVEPYRTRRVAVLVRERLSGAARERFEAAITAKLAWFGASAPEMRDAGDVASGARALVELRNAGVELVLVGGTGATDPLDPIFLALEQLDGRVVRRGVPAHPGSTYWLAELGDARILGLASCGMFSEMTALDLLLPRFFAGEDLTPETLTSLAAGGLIGRDRAYRFPKYRPAR
jgi:hypothetical protein